MMAWMILALVGCAPDPSQEWDGAFEVVSYRVAEAPEEPDETGTTDPTARTAATAACDAEPVEADWGYPGFAIDVAELDNTSYVEILKCEAPDDCVFVPWTAGGTTDLGPDGGRATLAASDFLASSLGGGACSLFWWTLTFSGTPDAPSLELLAEQAVVELDEGDAPDCEAKLGEPALHQCAGRYLVDGQRW